MPTIKSAKKRVKTTIKKTKINNRWKEKLKDEKRNLEELIEEGNLEEAEEQYKETVKIIDKCVNKNIIHQNKGNRKKSQYAKKINKLKENN